MALDFDKLTAEELLAAESAILTQRSLMQVVKTAPHGKGMAALEGVILKEGHEHLRKMMTAAAASHEEAQKKTGSAVGPAPAARPPRSSDARKKRS